MGLQTVDFNGVSDARFASTNSNAIGTALTAKTTKLSTNLFTLSNSSTSSVVVPNAGQAGYVVIDAVAASGQLWQIGRMSILASARPRAWFMASGRTALWQAGGAVALAAGALLLTLFGQGLIASFALLG
ncbi:MAG: hypothetical protein AAFR20_06530, partial [Pseudomonadota bacterium]